MLSVRRSCSPKLCWSTENSLEIFKSLDALNNDNTLISFSASAMAALGPFARDPYDLDGVEGFDALCFANLSDFICFDMLCYIDKPLEMRKAQWISRSKIQPVRIFERRYN